MVEGVKESVPVQTDTMKDPQSLSDKSRENFAKLEAAKEVEREARIRAEMQNEILRQEMQEIKNFLKPKEEDPLDGVEDYVDPARLKAKLAQERANIIREAEKIAKKTYEEHKQAEEKNDYLNRLKRSYSDYDSVVTEDNIANLHRSNPTLAQSLIKIGDDYARRELAYHYMKANTPKKEVPSIKEKVEENARNPFLIPSGSGTPTAVEFDLRSPQARDDAYSKLKSAQRRPIGNK